MVSPLDRKSCAVRCGFVLATLLLACGACGGSGGSPGPVSPVEPEKQMAKADDSTSCVVDGKTITFGDLQGRLGELVVDPKATSTSNLVEKNGRFGGTEEHYRARKKANGDVYDYMIVRTSTHHHYELTFRERGEGKPIAPASTEPPRSIRSMIDQREVDERTFERTLQSLDVDAEPWVNAHLMNAEGQSGSSASFEARDRKTGDRWTYETSSIGNRTSQSLTRGSRKPPARRP